MPSLVSFRRDAALAAGPYALVTANSSGHTTTTIVVDGLKTSTGSSELFTDWWVYLPAAAAADKIRRVSTFTPSTGTLTVDRVYSASSVPNSKVVELHSLFPPFSDDATRYDWTRAVNEALKRLWVTVEITITPTVNNIQHSLAAYTWITKETQVLDVGWLSSNETRAQVDPYATRPCFGEVERNGATLTLTLERSFASNETIYLRVARRAYDYCRANGGVYGDQSGLALESDEALSDLEQVRWGACIEAVRIMRNEVSDAGKDHLQTHQAEWSRLWSNELDKGGRLPQTRFRKRALKGFFNSRVGRIG